MKLGNIELNWLGNAGFLIEDGKKIYIDPYNLSGEKPKADIILITHRHQDHCSIVDMEKILKDGTTVILTADCQSKLTKSDYRINMQIIEPGDELELQGVKIQAVPAYNLDKEFHTKAEGWVGYIIKFENTIIYHAGDTDIIPEMEKLTGYGKDGNEFVALLPVGGKFTMNYEEAANAAEKIKPSLAIPMHYGSVQGTEQDADKFVELCKEKGIKAIKLEKK